MLAVLVVYTVAEDAYIQRGPQIPGVLCFI